MHPGHHKKKWSKYKENTKPKEIGKRVRKTVMGVDDLAQNIFDQMGGRSEDLKGAFGRPIDSTGKKARYGGIGEVGQ